MSTKQKVSFRIERASADEATFCDAFLLAMELHRLAGIAPFDHEVASESCYSALAEGMTFMARDLEGKAIGLIALTEMPLDYSRETFLQDRAFYVQPAWEGQGVRTALMKAAAQEGDRLSKFVLVGRTSLGGARKRKTQAAIEAELAGYVPIGYVLRLKQGQRQ